MRYGMEMVSEREEKGLFQQFLNHKMRYGMGNGMRERSSFEIGEQDRVDLLPL